MKQTDITEAIQAVTSRFQGQAIAYKGDYPGESFVPVAYYIEALTRQPAPADPYSWGNNLPKALSTYFERESYQLHKAYPVGTILYWNTPHVAIVIDTVISDTVDVFQQANGLPCNFMERPINTDYYTCTYALVPLLEGQSSAPPQRTVYVDETVDGIRYQKLPGEAPRKMYIKRTEGSQLIDFNTTVATPREFLSVPHSVKKYGEDIRIMGTASYPIKGYPDEVFYLTLDDWGDFTGTGRVANLQGYPKNDLTELRPPEITRPKGLVPITATAKPLVPLSDIRPASDIRSTLSDNFVRYPSEVQYVSEDSSTVMFYDLTGKGKPIALQTDSSATIIGELPHPKTGDIWLREGTTEKTGRWYCAPRDKLILEDEADALTTPTVAERLQRTTDPVTGKKTSGGRFSDKERRYIIPLAKLLAHYNHFSNKIKRK